LGIDVYLDSFTMTGGTIESAGYSIWRDRNNVSISGGTIKGGFYGDNGEIDITGGKCLPLKKVDSQQRVKNV